MRWLLGAAYHFFSDSLIDFVLFVLVDAVAKSPLRDARSAAEKRTIWMYESMVLSAVCVLIYVLDHTPYVCLILTLVTILYTQLLGRIDFRYWVRYALERWEDYQHHSENVQLINEKQKQMEILRNIRMQQAATLGKPVSKPVLSRLTNFITRRSDRRQSLPSPISVPNYTVTPNMNAGYMPNPQQNLMNNTGHISLNNPSPHVTPDARQAQHSGRMSLGSALKNTQHSPSLGKDGTSLETPTSKPVNNWFTKNELKRRPLQTYENKHLTSPYSSFNSGKSSIKNRFMSAFGFTEKNDKPGGLINQGQNLCFMNCVIQCLSRTPGLVRKLHVEPLNHLDCSATEVRMIQALTQILSKCRQNRNQSTLDPSTLRQALSRLNGSLVMPLHDRQYQQDAAEFFMWLVESLHTALNKKSSGSPERPIAKGSVMETLKFIYGDINAAKAQDLKDACRKEISAADGLKTDSYAEPIQRLSDLEWLTYKKENNSIIDECFSGQLIEAYRCLVDNHLTVTTQTFNILPVPIVPAREMSGLVHLEDCFTKFCNIERMVGPEGVQCEHCTQNATPSASRPAGQKKTKANNQDSSRSVFHSIFSPSCMSPIPRQEGANDTAQQDNFFRTSTPVSGENSASRFLFPARQVRETERRCLLRQLPDCLVIQPLRFSFNQFTRQSRKICSAINIPLRGLDLTSIVYDNVTNRDDMTAGNKGYIYDLYAICVHLGAESTSYGHYICYCQAENGAWYKFDDELVWEVNIEFEIRSREIRENAYLLFYKRAEDSPS